jgi:hypothetical protein
VGYDLFAYSSDNSNATPPPNQRIIANIESARSLFESWPNF